MDGVFCNGVENCDFVVGCVVGSVLGFDDGVDCIFDLCDEDSDSVSYVMIDVVCDDGVFCNGQHICDIINGCVKVLGSGVDDGIVCTIDICDEVIKSIINFFDNSVCNDGLFCNGIEKCDASVGCVLVVGSKLNLDDNVVCTIDSCDEIKDVVFHVFDSMMCNDFIFCNG